MREIKFRAWDKDTKQMITDFSVRSDGYVEVLEGDGRSGKFMRQDFVLMQYTGLKDKNGVEIYEGDIVRQPIGLGIDDEHEVTAYIDFADGGYRGVIKDMGKKGKYIIDLHEYTNPGEFEVIGNIYEHPELLEQS